MAKKKTSAGNFTFSDIGNLMNDMNKHIPFVVADEKEEQNQEYIQSGIYILNAALSGSLFGGIQSNRITALAGESGTGKSFLAYGFCKQAQANGYSIIYIDTEFSIQLRDLPNYGIDTNNDKFKLVRMNIAEDIIKFVTTLTQQLKDVKMNGGEIPKLLICLDSVGMISSRKELEDNNLANGNKETVDMTRSKKLTAFFRIINSDLGMLNVPMICTNHTYKDMGLFPKDIMKGGNGLRYSASVIGFLSKAKLKTGEEDDMDTGQSGITVTFKADKNRLAKPKKVKFDISFVSGCNPYKGLEGFCRPEFFDTIGIAKGKWEEYKTPVEKVDKTTGEVKIVTGEFKPGGNHYFVRHLGKSMYESQLFNSNVFTKEILEKMDVHVKNYFKYKSLDEMDAALKEFEQEAEDYEYDPSVDTDVDIDLF